MLKELNQQPQRLLIEQNVAQALVDCGRDVAGKFDARSEDDGDEAAFYAGIAQDFGGRFLGMRSQLAALNKQRALLYVDKRLRMQRRDKTKPDESEPE